MNKQHFKESLYISIGLFFASMLTFVILVFLVMGAHFTFDALLSQIVVSFGMSLYLLFILQFRSWALNIFYGIGMIAAFISLYYATSIYGIDTATQSGLFVWIVVNIAGNVAGWVAYLGHRSKKRQKEKLSQANSKLEEIKIEKEALETAALTENNQEEIIEPTIDDPIIDNPTPETNEKTSLED
ncbi:MAG: hypothetical protein RR565_08785 [Erysipelothrix sp.]